MFAGTVLLAASAISAPQEEARADEPRSPDLVEAQVDAIQPWIDDLCRWLASGEGIPFDDPGVGNLWIAPDPEVVQRSSVGGFDVDRLGIGNRTEGVQLRSTALRSALLGPHAAADDIIVKAKVVEVRDRRWYGLRIEASGDGWQVTARVSAQVPGRRGLEDRGDAMPPATEAAGPIRCGSFTVHTVERVTSSAPHFVERTAGVFANAPDAARRLGVGMDRWAQRLDDPALSAWFGHQGLAAGDVNGDGRDDLYVAMPSGLPNMLLLQQADGTVRDIAPQLGVSWLDDTKGVLLVDVDADGRLDVVSALGHVIVVQRNVGGALPYEVGNEAFPIAGWCVAPDEAPFYGISAADVDADGDLDLFGARYVTTRYADTVPVPFEDARNGPSNHLFRNDAGRFVDVSAEMGLVEPGGRFSLQGVFTDFDLDGDPDLHVVNDFGRNQMFVLEDGKYVDRAAELGLEDQGAGMGASWSDFDQDGDLDVYVTNMFSSAGRRVAFQSTFGEGRTDEELAGIRRLSLGNSLFVRDGDAFADRSDDAGVRMGRWAWGAVFCDLNGDGYDDLVSPSGFLTGPEPGDL